jgi:hypothetical protein
MSQVEEVMIPLEDLQPGVIIERRRTVKHNGVADVVRLHLDRLLPKRRGDPRRNRWVTTIEYDSHGHNATGTTMTLTDSVFTYDASGWVVVRGGVEELGIGKMIKNKGGKW